MELKPMIDALRAGAVVEDKAIALPDGYKLEALERFQAEPNTARGRLSMHSIQSLASYAAAHGNAASALFSDQDKKCFTVVLDWHDQSEQVNGWGDHTAEYQLHHTPEWKAWNGISGRAMAQTAFAEFIEENLPDVIEPTSADLLEAILNVSGKKNITFKTAKNLTNGDTQLIWDETTETNGTTKGEASLPSKLTIKIPVYRGAEKETTFEIKAFLRYRIHEGKLAFELKLHRPEKAAEQAYLEVQEALGKLMPETFNCYEGGIVTPPDKVR